MTGLAVHLDHVYKKFTKGEGHDSLRDFFPALAARVMRRVMRPSELKNQEFWALQDISIEIRKGEAVGIIGHNGAGKSTMLKLLCGILHPTNGQITVSGKLSALIEVSAGFHQDLTGRENVFLNGVILGMSKAEIRRKFDEIVEFSGLAEFIDTPVKRYSTGMHARLGFSVAAHMEPEILIVDEVLSVGDLMFQAKCMQKMRSVLNSGATVIFVSHNLNAISELCARALLFRQGRLVEDGVTSDVIHTYMEEARNRRGHDDDRRVVIESISVSGPDGPRSDFPAGTTVCVEVQFRAVQRVEKLGCLLYLQDKDHRLVFDASTDRLGLPAMSVEPDETVTCSFELDLHLAAGAFRVCSILFRCDSNYVVFDQLESAAALLVRSPFDVRGVANLYPRVHIK